MDTPMDTMEALVQAVATCTDCSLCETRTQSVPGEGSNNPEILFIGEGPGLHEDQQGRPFVGPSGKLLDGLLGLIGLTRPDVYIANVVKCRPPNNRDPLPEEIKACRKYLDQQIQLLDPKVIVTLGRFSLVRFLPQETISKVHGQPRLWGHRYIFPMYHPAAALHQGNLRHVLEEDMRKLPDLLQRIQQEDTPEGIVEETLEPEQLQML
jgi:uracil-DNA glycosylase family 4